jgi:hypothetical protein
MIDYLFHRFNASSFRLAMSIVVKNEADIIEASIRTHSNLGVDAFAIMDNNSSDGTREILARLQSEFEIIIVDERGIFKQAKWMRQLAGIAKQKLKADWVINNDADEFWLPRNGLSLKQNLAFKGSVLTCSRYNMLLDEVCNASGNCFDAQYYVTTPIAYPKGTIQTNKKRSCLLGKIGPKVIVNPHGLISLRSGNHKALHIANMLDYLIPGYDSIKRFGKIEVFHYPIRSYAQFETNVINRRHLIECGITVGPHYRRWVQILNQGGLMEEFNMNFVQSSTDIETLCKYDIVRMDPSIRKAIVSNRV